MWARDLDLDEEFSQLNVVTLPGADYPPLWYWDQLLADWGWARYDMDNGVLRGNPSDRGQKVCPTGQKADPPNIPTDLQTCVGERKSNHVTFTRKTDIWMVVLPEAPPPLTVTCYVSLTTSSARLCSPHGT